MAEDFTTALAQFALTFRLADLAPGDRAHLEDAFVNWVACAIGGAGEASVDALVAGYAAIGDGGVHRLLGRAERVGLIEAVAIDCLSSAVLAFDDIHFETGLHPTGPVAAAILGVARRQTVRGADLLAALHVGMEIECRVALALAGDGVGVKLGWYPTGLAGGIGAAAAIARLLQLDLDGVVSAMALAAARACGNRGTHGSRAAAYVPSTGAESGLFAAYASQAGLTCGAGALDGPNGLLRLLVDAPAIARARAGLGATAISAATAFKPYPSGFVTHAAIDACLEGRCGANSITRGTISVSPRAASLGDNARPANALEAQVSIQHWAALALLHRAAGIAQTAPDLLADGRVAALRDRLTVVGDVALADTQARVTLEGPSSRCEFVEHASGSPGRPLSREQVDAKARDLLASRLSPERAGALHTVCRDIASSDDVSAILLI